tara:strand:- start:1608 stop:1748 length:141 start_codon:yes stop_codon:yes gene_type:complete
MAVFKINQEEINQYLARYEGNTPLVVFPRGFMNNIYIKKEISDYHI